jgi:hypothetical protein
MVRDRASYVEEARGIARRSFFVLGLNALLWILLVASGGLASPTAHGSPVILGIGLGSALIVPIATVWLDARRNRPRNYGVYVGLIGTALLWGPLYLLAMFGHEPDIVMDLTLVGSALLIASAFFRPPTVSN